jgi:hypothetical protein
MLNTSLVREYRFQFANAGYCVGHRAEGALSLARASMLLSELQAQDLVTVRWEYDEYADNGPVDWDWSEKDIERWNRSNHEVEACAIEDSDGNVLASLSGIWDADARYRHVVEAELALECYQQLQEIASRAEYYESETLA